MEEIEEILEARMNPSYVPAYSPYYDLSGRHGLYVIYAINGSFEYPTGRSWIAYIGRSSVGEGGVGRRLHDHASRRGNLDLHELFLTDADLYFTWAPIEGLRSPEHEVAVACAEDQMLDEFAEHLGTFPYANRNSGSCWLGGHYRLIHRPGNPIAATLEA